MKITKEFLETKNACTKGIKEFIKIFPNGFNLEDWNFEKQMELLKTPLREYFGWVYYNKVLPIYSMNNSDLSNSNLRNCDLKYSDLSNSNLRNSDLSGSNLRYSDLRYSNLSGSDLRGSDLSGSDLRYSDLSNSNLSGSDLRNCDLSNSDLSGSIINKVWSEKIKDTVCYGKNLITWID
jgi:uncharacterized protein YjbI with pentapeptide repeats